MKHKNVVLFALSALLAVSPILPYAKPMHVSAQEQAITSSNAPSKIDEPIVLVKNVESSGDGWTFFGSTLKLTAQRFNCTSTGKPVFYSDETYSVIVEKPTYMTLTGAGAMFKSAKSINLNIKETGSLTIDLNKTVNGSTISAIECDGTNDNITAIYGNLAINISTGTDNELSSGYIGACGISAKDSILVGATSTPSRIVINLNQRDSGVSYATTGIQTKGNFGVSSPKSLVYVANDISGSGEAKGLVIEKKLSGTAGNLYLTAKNGYPLLVDTINMEINHRIPDTWRTESNNEVVINHRGITEPFRTTTAHEYDPVIWDTATADGDSSVNKNDAGEKDGGLYMWMSETPHDTFTKSGSGFATFKSFADGVYGFDYDKNGDVYTNTSNYPYTQNDSNSTKRSGKAKTVIITPNKDVAATLSLKTAKGTSSDYISDDATKISVEKHKEADRVASIRFVLTGDSLGDDVLKQQNPIYMVDNAVIDSTIYGDAVKITDDKEVTLYQKFVDYLRSGTHTFSVYMNGHTVSRLFDVTGADDNYVNEYTVLEGDGQSVVKQYGMQPLLIDASKENIVSVKVDGSVVSSSNYGVYAHSTNSNRMYLRFDTTYLSNLATGAHSIEVDFTGGYAKATINMLDNANGNTNNGSTNNNGSTTTPKYIVSTSYNAVTGVLTVTYSDGSTTTNRVGTSQTTVSPITTVTSTGTSTAYSGVYIKSIKKDDGELVVEYSDGDKDEYKLEVLSDDDDDDDKNKNKKTSITSMLWTPDGSLQVVYSDGSTESKSYPLNKTGSSQNGTTTQTNTPVNSNSNTQTNTSSANNTSATPSSTTSADDGSVSTGEDDSVSTDETDKSAKTGYNLMMDVYYHLID